MTPSTRTVCLAKSGKFVRVTFWKPGCSMVIS